MAFAIVIAALSLVSNGREAEKYRGKGEDVHRTITGTFDNQRNRVSRINFFNSNYGIFGQDIRNRQGGGFWPRGSSNQYVYGAGVWFALQKRRPGNDSIFNKLCLLSYNPNNGRSMFSPGRITDGELIQDQLAEKHRVYFSTDYRRRDGLPLNPANGASVWPLWDIFPSSDTNNVLKRNRYFGTYIDNPAQRNRSTYERGPAFISGEDIFSTFKDTDLSRNELGLGFARTRGYPIQMQIEKTIYSWGFGEYRDFIFLKYLFTNFSNDTLRQCWMAPAFDMDLTPVPPGNGYNNDRCRFYNEDTTLNLAIQWTNTNVGEAGRGFGYLGLNFLESPATYPYSVIDTVIVTPDSVIPVRRFIGLSPDSVGRIRKDKRFYRPAEQIGLRTFRNWSIANDPGEDDERYNFVSLGQREGDTGPGDKRFLMATGPFNMFPRDSARVVVGLIFAPPSVSGEASGETADLALLVARTKFAQDVYDNNFRAPQPPDNSLLRYTPLNNAIMVQWDSTAEQSFDELETGLDFLGYRLYRSRMQNVDSFSVSDQVADPTVNRGPFGPREVARYQMPFPFVKSNYRITPAGASDLFPGPSIDSFRVVSQDPIDRQNYIIRRFPNGGSKLNPYGVGFWGRFFSSLNQQTLDRFMTGRLRVNPAIRNNPPNLRRGGLLSPSAFYPDTSIKWATDTNSQTGVRIDLPYTILPVLNWHTRVDSTRYHNVIDTLLRLVQDGTASITFEDVDADSILFRRLRDEVIVPTMDSLTRGRTFVDYGDVDGNLIVNTDPQQSVKDREGIINNVTYYYSLRAYDEGAYKEFTPAKFNDAQETVNSIATVASAARGSSQPSPTIQIVSVDSSRLGGLFNFRFGVLDADRVNQLFTNDTVGHDLELTISPVDEGFPDAQWTPVPSPAGRGNYTYKAVELQLRDLTLNKQLARFRTWLEPTACAGSFFVSKRFTENGAAYVSLPRDTVITDTTTGEEITFASDASDDVDLRKGTFSTVPQTANGTCYLGYIEPEARGAVSISFDYAIQQNGGQPKLIGEGIIAAPSGANTLVVRPEFWTIASARLRSQTIPAPHPGARPTTQFVLPNVDGANGLEVETAYQGPSRFELTFSPGGTIEVPVTYNRFATRVTKTFTIPYLNVEVKNTRTYNRPRTLLSTDSVAVGWGDQTTVEHHDDPFFGVDSTRTFDAVSTNYEELQRLVPAGKFNLSAYGYVNGRAVDPSQLIQLRPILAGQVAQGRYLLSGQADDGTVIDFSHFFVANGAQWGIDFANKLGRRFAAGRGSAGVLPDQWPVLDQPTTDFAAGDRIFFETFGGAHGLPTGPVVIRAKVNKSTPLLADVTDGDLEKVTVVPNPFIVNHQSMRSPYEARIFFTRLPKRCTIKIFTVNGDLIQTVEHDELSSPEPDRTGVNIWDLLSTNRQRVGSQGLVAVIETPNGSRTLKKFAVVNGGFRLIPDQE